MHVDNNMMAKAILDRGAGHIYQQSRPDRLMNTNHVSESTWEEPCARLCIWSDIHRQMKHQKLPLTASGCVLL
eukprot:m.293744 g.293744  ORF g.293744 m.293744 type:complete len:73 (-) comp20024_c0_seq1:1131-1349(-)